MPNGLCAECYEKPVYVTPGGKKQGYCYDCMKELQQVMHQIKKEYPYELTLELQSGVCAICRRPPNAGETFQYDHNHRTKKFRGLVCAQCNQGLAGFRDRVDFLERAIVYLQDPNRLKHYMRDVVNYQARYETRRVRTYPARRQLAVIRLPVKTRPPVVVRVPCRRCGRPTAAPEGVHVKCREGQNGIS